MLRRVQYTGPGIAASLGSAALIGDRDAMMRHARHRHLAALAALLRLLACAGYEFTFPGHSGFGNQVQQILPTLFLAGAGLGLGLGLGFGFGFGFRLGLALGFGFGLECASPRCGRRRC